MIAATAQMDNLPPIVAIPLAIVLWGLVIYMYVIKPRIQRNKENKK